MIPGEPMLNVIYINVEGIVNDFVEDTWFVFGIDASVDRDIEVVVEI